MKPPSGPPNPEPAPKKRLAAGESKRDQRDVRHLSDGARKRWRTETLKQRSLLQRNQIGCDDRGHGHQTTATHTCDESAYEEGDHGRRKAAEGRPSGEQRQGDQEGVPSTDDVGEASVQRREGGGTEEVARAEETGLV